MSSLGTMAITHQEAREQILEVLATAIEHIALSVECLGEAYEQMSDAEADRLEAELFGPVQKAYGVARRTRQSFSQRVEVSGREPDSLSPGSRSQGAKDFVDRAVFAAEEADREIAELQDTMYPIESGDAELRAGLAEVRDLLDGLPGASRELLRTLGR